MPMYEFHALPRATRSRSSRIAGRLPWDTGMRVPREVRAEGKRMSALVSMLWVLEGPENGSESMPMSSSTSEERTWACLRKRLWK